MAAMNFPINPTVGQEYQWNAFTYVWDGEKWTTKVDVDPEGYVKRSGETMTGGLYVDGGNGIVVGHVNNGIHYMHNGLQWNAYYDADNGSYNLIEYTDGSYVSPRLIIFKGGAVAINDPKALSPQGTNVDSLTRKDYVDATLLETREALQVQVDELRGQVLELVTLLQSGVTVV